METGSAVDTEAGLEVVAAPQWLIVACNGGSYAVALSSVCEIVAPRPFTRLPGCGAHVCGLVGIRGRAITAFDFGVLLGGEPSAARPDYRLLLVDHGDRRLGLVVDEVWRAAGMLIDGAAGAGNGSLDAGDVLGAGSVDGRVVTALDTDRLFERLLV